MSGNSKKEILTSVADDGADSGATLISRVLFRTGYFSNIIRLDYLVITLNPRLP